MPTSVVVGIAVHAEPRRFAATLDSVRRHAPGAAVVAIPDTPDAETAAALTRRPGVHLLPPPDAIGGAACLNRLLGSTDAAVCVLLESGCLVSPGWLDRLMEGLSADPRNGLAGPSTNRSWNPQQAEPRCTGTEVALAEAARRRAARHGGEARTLEPLHTLADFCYAVRREVWDAVGAADEGYGAGPCWEMDYNARAARAGWRGVWVPAAFVWRAPFTARRARDERRLFEASRRRYQDRLCALRLKGGAGPYEPHCRGDACEHFAPASLIQLRIEPKPAPPAVPPAPPPADAPAPRAHLRPSPENAAPDAAAVPGEPPLISCIMPTRGRTELALQAVCYFQAQDYPRLELIVVDDAGSDLGARLPADPRIRYDQVPAGWSIGAKRNRAVERAKGEIVAQWDDDDWYAPQRLRVQAAPILAGRADVTALRADVFFDLETWEFWGCTPALHRRLFVSDVHGGTLMYRRRVWGPRASYPPASLAEDAAFLTRAVRGGARLLRVDEPGLYVYLRHGANAWRFACGGHVDPAGWIRLEEPPYLAPDRAFYLARSAAARAAAPTPARRVRVAAGEAPLVSCLMPTADRRRFVPRAIELFLRQDYAARELVIVDDGRDAVEDLVPADPRIRYVRAERSATLGAKRNLACSLARGPLLAHWDDDDWAADDRLSRQVGALQATGAEVCGLSVVRYFDPAARLAWEYRWTDGSRPWVGGNTLLYRRAAWERRPFPGLNVGEDTRWVWAQPSPSVHAMGDSRFFAALVHPRNTSQKQTRGSRWHPIPLSLVQEQMGEDWAFYAGMAREAAAV